MLAADGINGCVTLYLARAAREVYCSVDAQGAVTDLSGWLGEAGIGSVASNLAAYWNAQRRWLGGDRFAERLREWEQRTSELDEPNSPAGTERLRYVEHLRELNRLQREHGERSGPIGLQSLTAIVTADAPDPLREMS